MKAEDFIELIEQNRFDKISKNGMTLIAERFRELQSKQLTLTDVVSSVDFEKPTFREMREEVLSNQLWSEQNELYRHFKWGTKTLREAYEIATS